MPQATVAQASGRVCTGCKTWKSAEHFNTGAGYKGGLRSTCKACVRRRYLERRPEIRKRINAYRRANPEKNKRWRAAERARRIERTYGLSEVEYEALRAGGCMICGSHKRICVDHDHTTGKVRGALCHRCNRAIGFLGDTAENVERAAAYLRGELSDEDSN